MILSPSCWPEVTSCGRYTSTPLIYTRFSSYEPPRTEYCDDISLEPVTPAIVLIIDSTDPPLTSGDRR